MGSLMARRLTGIQDGGTSARWISTGWALVSFVQAIIAPVIRNSCAFNEMKGVSDSGDMNTVWSIPSGHQHFFMRSFIEVFDDAAHQEVSESKPLILRSDSDGRNSANFTGVHGPYADREPNHSTAYFPTNGVSATGKKIAFGQVVFPE